MPTRCGSLPHTHASTGETQCRGIHSNSGQRPNSLAATETTTTPTRMRAGTKTVGGPRNQRPVLHPRPQSQNLQPPAQNTPAHTATPNKSHRGPQGTAVALARQMQDWQHWQRQLTITIFAFLIFKGHLQTPCKQIQPTPTSSLLQATCQQRLLRNLTGQQTPTVTS